MRHCPKSSTNHSSHPLHLAMRARLSYFTSAYFIGDGVVEALLLKCKQLVHTTNTKKTPDWLGMREHRIVDFGPSSD